MSQDIFQEVTLRGQRLTQKQKNSNNKQWYKDEADRLDNRGLMSDQIMGYGGISEYTRKRVNYDLFNNYLNMKDLEYVCQPFGASGGELPATMTNRDIVSPKIKVLLGMEMKMPFSWKTIAVNQEATTRKEQQEFGMIKDFVTSEIMKPIRMQLEQQQVEQTKGKKLTPEEQQQLQADIEEQLQAKTPDEVRKYMAEEHQDPAENMMHQILEYLILEQRVSEKFNRGFKHSMLGGEDLYHVGIFNGKPTLSVVNNLRFKHDDTIDLEGIEDGNWAVCEYRWTPNEVITKLGSGMTKEEIERVYSFEDNRGIESITTADFDTNNYAAGNTDTVRVLHCTWKSEMKIGFLIYNSIETGKEEMMLVDENYKLNLEAGDISIQWEWIPETHEVWKVLNDIYPICRPVPGQHKDINNLWEAKLPYYGAACDAMNSIVTSPMDRIKAYQYYYNIILYRIELLMASDKGKILLMNIKAIPKSAGIDTSKFLYFMEANKMAFYSTSEEGMKNANGEAGSIAKEIDMSLASDIQKYINMAEYIETKCGAAIGVTRAMEGAIGPTDAVTNTKQNLVQASHIVQPYFELHNIVKGKVLKALVETAKVAYSENPPGTLSYVLDDMSVKMLTVDQGLLDSSTYGLFISNSGKAEDAKNAVIQLAQAALQNQQADLADIAKVIRSESINEVEELLEMSQQKKQAQAQESDKQKVAQQQQAQDQQMSITREEWEHEKEMIILKASEDRKTKLAVEAMAAMGFDPNKDEDGDGTPDVLEVMKHGLDAQVKTRQLNQNDEKLAFEKDKLAQKDKIDNAKLKNDKEKIAVAKSKSSSGS